MRIDGPYRAARPGAPAPRKAGASGFSLEGSGASAASTRTGPSRQIGMLDAVLALQEVEDATQRRAKALRQGHDMLDMLEDLRVAVLSGRIAPDRLERLARLSSEVPAGEGGLSEVLAEIALRAQVELAKLGRFPPF